jgi:hypothetical protein
MRDIYILRSQHIRMNAHNARQPAATSPIAGRPSTQSKRYLTRCQKNVRLDVPTSNVLNSIITPHTSSAGFCKSPATLVPLVASARICSFNAPFIKLLPHHGPFICPVIFPVVEAAADSAADVPTYSGALAPLTGNGIVVDACDPCVKCKYNGWGCVGASV